MMDWSYGKCEGCPREAEDKVEMHDGEHYFCSRCLDELNKED